MKLASALSSDFNADIRARGASYYRLGAVRVKRGNATEVMAAVRGSRVYDVEITWDGRSLSLFCDCPYFDTAGPCKHIWATILAADAQNYFTAITRLNPRDIHYDEIPDLENAGDDDSDILPPPRPAPGYHYEPQIVLPA